MIRPSRPFGRGFPQGIPVRLLVHPDPSGGLHAAAAGRMTPDANLLNVRVRPACWRGRRGALFSCPRHSVAGRLSSGPQIARLQPAIGAPLRERPAPLSNRHPSCGAFSLQACDLDPASVKRRRADVSLQVKSRRRNFGKQKTAYPVEYPGRKNRSRAPNMALPNCNPPHRTESKIQLRTPPFPICNMALAGLCATLRAAPKKQGSVNVVDGQRDGSTEFSGLYMRLLNAALDEANSSLLPRARERNLAAHVARGISMTGLFSRSFSDQGFGHEETTLL